jgi:predicted GNAT superfamily acetyltransferase
MEKIGAEVRDYMPNFYGTDYGASQDSETKEIPIHRERLFALWKLDSPKAAALAAGDTFTNELEPVAEVVVPYDWNSLVTADRKKAAAEQMRIRAAFMDCLARDLVCRGFVNDAERPRYLFFGD